MNDLPPMAAMRGSRSRVSDGLPERTQFLRYVHSATRRLAVMVGVWRKWHMDERWHRLTGGIFRSSPRTEISPRRTRPWLASLESEALHGHSGAEDRAYWVEVLSRIALPVLDNLARGTLRENMPVECGGGSRADRRQFSHLEACGRLLAGIAPWIDLVDSAALEAEGRGRIGELARHALHSATDPASPDFLNFHSGRQPLVDAAYLAQALLRAPNTLWANLPVATRANVITALRATRRIRPVENNWLLFSAIVEAALKRLDGDWEPDTIQYALRRHEEWYKGDGAYGDGAHFCWDYYNSFVIHPMLLSIMEAAPETVEEWPGLRERIVARAVRYAEILEKMISPAGTFPAMGRSIAYRTGAFHHLANMALLKRLPLSVAPAQVRCALTAVIRRTFEAPGTFDEQGWLRIGFAGHQPKLGEFYLSTGSLYACTLAFLPLGLSPSDDFWHSPPQDWSSRRMWAGMDMIADEALEGWRYTRQSSAGIHNSHIHLIRSEWGARE